MNLINSFFVMIILIILGITTSKFNGSIEHIFIVFIVSIGMGLFAGMD